MRLEARADEIGYAHVLRAKRSGRARREEELFWRAVKLSQKRRFTTILGKTEASPG